MAIVFQDYFEHALGPYTPPGFTVTAFVHDIVLGGIDGGKAWNLFGNADFVGPSNYTSQSLFFAIKVGIFGGGNRFVRLFNSSGPSQRILLDLRAEDDHTVTVVLGDGTIAGNSGQPGANFSLNPNTWYFFQLNTTFTKQTVMGVDYLGIASELAVDGVSLFSNTTTTTITIASMPTGAAEMNEWLFQFAYLMDSLTAESPVVPIDTYPNPGSPVARVTQALHEVAALPNDALNRVTQGAVELGILPSDSKNRITQMVIELMVSKVAATGAFFMPMYYKRKSIAN